MGGRFGKYGDNKRLKALQRGRREKSRLERAAKSAMIGRTGLARQASGPAQPSRRSAKTFQSAVVIIPPEEIWEPIQGLRRKHDRHYRRWMPHITLVYPFRPFSEFERLIPQLDRACRALTPFEIRLASFGCFDRSGRNATLFLIPEPAGGLKTLQTAILTVVPDCDDLCRFSGGYTPHLSIGQVWGKKARALCAEWQTAWRPLTFTVTHICLIWRNSPPDDIFRSGPTLRLGG
jgi:2'-5' RNA ligase